MKVWIGEECDGFEVRVFDDTYSSLLLLVRIGQEDSVEGLVEVFEQLGCGIEYEVLC